MATCPICSKPVPQSLLERHVNSCFRHPRKRASWGSWESWGKEEKWYLMPSDWSEDSKRKKVEAKSKNRPSLTQLLIEEKRIRNRFDVERHAEGGEEIPNNIKEEEEGSSSLEDGGIAEIEENQNVSQRGGENHHISQGGDPEVLEISANNPEPLNNSEVVIEQVSKLADSSLSKDHLNQTTNAEVIIPSTSSDQTETQTSLPQSLQGLAPTKSNNSQASDKFENSQPTKKPIHSQPSHPLHIPKSQNISSPTRNASQNAYQEKSIATTLSHNLHSRGSHVPLAHLLRPQTLADFQGQETLLGKNGLLRNIIHARPYSFISTLGTSWSRKNLTSTDHSPFY